MPPKENEKDLQVEYEWEDSDELPPYRPWETEGWTEEDDEYIEWLVEDDDDPA